MLQIFSTTLNQMLILFLFMLIGFFFNKRKLLPANDSVVLSKLETNLLLPCVIFNTFYENCTVEHFKAKWTYILYGAVITIVSLIIGIVLAKVFAKERYLRKIYAYSFAVANFGFMGIAVVKGLYSSEVLFDYMMFTLPLNLYVYSYGIASLIPQNQGKGLKLKMFINPSFISLVVGAVFGLLSIQFPTWLSFVPQAVTLAGNCMSPLAMLLTGFVIGDYSLKKLMREKKIYFTSVIRLIFLPTIFVLVLKALHTDSAIVLVALCATAMPLGLNTIVFPAAYGADTTPGASMALISNLMSVITIPILFALLLN